MICFVVLLVCFVAVGSMGQWVGAITFTKDGLSHHVQMKSYKHPMVQSLKQ